ncbi:MAG: hypothetical protein ACYTF7_06655 [Planctomycetota bacterium]
MTRFRIILGVWFVLLSLSGMILLVVSRGDPWFAGHNHEPNWAWAVGSGRLKIWVAGPDYALDWWPNMYYRGLDGSPLRWDLQFVNNTTRGVYACAIPFWLLAGLSGGMGALFLTKPIATYFLELPPPSRCA